MRAIIVLADDEPDLRSIYAACLRNEGYEVWEASDGREALALVDARRPDLLLLDVWMPVLNGLEVVEHLRNAHGIRGALTDFRADETECTVTFKGPGYAADAIIDRESGHYNLTQTFHGFIAIINDLHKGRDTGPVWSVVIDLSAAIMTVTPFLRISIVLHFLRQALGTQSTPSNQVLVGLSLFLPGPC